MSAALFDLALRTRAAQRGGAVPRLLHNPCPVRAVQVAVCARRVGRVVRVEAVGPSGRRETGSGPAGLSALARAAGVADGNLGDGPTAIIDGHATLCALDALACSYADPGRSAGIDVAAGSALAWWWVERAAHPGTTAVCDVLAASRQRYVLGVPAGADTALLWRKTFGVPSGVAGMLDWQRAIGSGAMLEGLTMQRQDDDWLLGQYQKALTEHRSWDRGESLHLAAVRLASRCDAADLYAAALLGDPLWRARGVHTGHVCHGQVIVGAGSPGNRVVVQASRLDTRLRAGNDVLGWPGNPMAAMPGQSARFGGEVVATAVRGGALTVTVAGLRRGGYRPAAGETLTIIAAPPNVSTILSRRAVVSRLYKRRFSWLSQGVTPAPVRRPVPLAVLIAAAEDTDTDSVGRIDDA
ncbi:hypothetical protein [Mycobacteroides abscessus]|uniref:hypothetical protein n=2 Tax=Mycobacteroides abscessus TaxID=36809 RepID=UPI000929FA51|nr:hypothetical protein [Mycobacteroides abscessus]SII85574.1 Uncharacterised protein [Mycobacteroides abscessus subsp. abscessus]SIK55319.1 Uncharacterised protein [Mycobacteroides abscessus subsp. abscessus]SIL85630.1 Uncharacterised protein [Mycobacteroides abscessus subsp. abscessus]SIM10342.1 Uncharacterised protein [Mycobacteroides abscessus subsp. abscessus]SIM31619.1 Uncharacterised protein [Mycobacteroides abscessus subsp. abscessus]